MRNRVREQRTQRGLSQAEVAAALGVSRQTVISIEGGRYLLMLPQAFAIARFGDQQLPGPQPVRSGRRLTLLPGLAAGGLQRIGSGL